MPPWSSRSFVPEAATPDGQRPPVAYSLLRAQRVARANPDTARNPSHEVTAPRRNSTGRGQSGQEFEAVPKPEKSAIAWGSDYPVQTRERGHAIPMNDQP